MIIWSIEAYRDGGTLSIKLGGDKEICVDARIGTTTPGKLTWGHPGRGENPRMLTEREESELESALVEYEAIQNARILVVRKALHDTP